MWSIDSAGDKIRSDIKKEIIVITTFGIFNFLFSFYAGFLHVKIIPEDIESLVVLRLFQVHFPNHFQILTLIFKSTYFLLSYVMIVHCYQVIYYTQHLRFQFIMLQEYIANIDKHNASFNTFEHNLFYNQKYQNEIERRFKFCIKRCSDLIS